MEKNMERHRIYNVGYGGMKRMGGEGKKKSLAFMI